MITNVREAELISPCTFYDEFGYTKTFHAGTRISIDLFRKKGFTYKEAAAIDFYLANIREGKKIYKRTFNKSDEKVLFRFLS